MKGGKFKGNLWGGSFCQLVLTRIEGDRKCAGVRPSAREMDGVGLRVLTCLCLEKRYCSKINLPA
jgi:hypothetical protein